MMKILSKDIINMQRVSLIMSQDTVEYRHFLFLCLNIWTFKSVLSKLLCKATVFFGRRGEGGRRRGEGDDRNKGHRREVKEKKNR